MNLQHPYFFLILIFFTLLYWLTPKTWRLRLATFIGFITWFIFAPFSALFCFILALITYRFTKAPTFLLSIILFASFLIFRASLSHLNLEHGIVPWVGASFFILRCIHYVFYRAQHKSQSSSFEQFFFYLFFPATILIGPVQRFEDFTREVIRSRFDKRNISAGLERMIWGYFKIIFVASYLIGTKLSPFILTLEQGGIRSYLECLEYGFSLYFKFAGYSDIAIACGLFMGIRLPENFYYPFFATNIANFWRRWNATVSAWCRDHVSFPLYATTRNMLLASLVSMLVLGLWHETSVRYLLWGLYHGSGIMLWHSIKSFNFIKNYQATRSLKYFISGVSWFITFNFVIIGFAITKSNNLKEILIVFKSFLGY